MSNKRKFIKDEAGEASTGFKLFIVLIIGLLVWQFGAPYFGISPLTSYLREYTAEDEPTSITYSFKVFDRITLEYVTLDSIENMDHSTGTALNDVWENRVEASFTDDTLGWNIDGDGANIPNYEIHVFTNAPSSLFAPQWKIDITGSENPYHFWSGGYQWIEHEFQSWKITSGSGEKTFKYQLTNENAVVSHTFGEWTYYLITLTDPAGSIIWQDNVFMW